VDSISAGTGSRFSLLPPENATGNWVKVVQRVPVKIQLDPRELDNPQPLRAGMSAVVTIKVR
jgi:membrane fusion protein (multidrug efflux system)